MMKNHYDKIVGRLPRFGLKSMATLIKTYISNQTFFIKSTIYSKIIYLFYKKQYNFILKTYNCISISNLYLYILYVNNFVHCTSFYIIIL